MAVPPRQTDARAPIPNADGASGAVEESFRGVLTAYGLLSRIMGPHFARRGISGAKWGVLRTLHRAEREGKKGLRMVDLGERLLVQPPSVSTLVARLRRDGLVSVRAAAADNRAKEVVLTRRGRALLEGMLEAHRARVRMVMSTLGDDDLQSLANLLGRLNTGLRTMKDDPALAAGAPPPTAGRSAVA